MREKLSKIETLAARLLQKEYPDPKDQAKHVRWAEGEFNRLGLWPIGNLRDDPRNVLFNLITLYWPGGFVHGKDVYLMISGGLLLVAHPIFMSIPMLVWYFIRKGVGQFRAVLVFPLVWVAFEYAHASTQLSFPWLTLGYTQTYDLAVVQMASVTGVYGIVLALLNVLLWLFVVTADRQRGGRGHRASGTDRLHPLLYAAPSSHRWLTPSVRRIDEGGCGHYRRTSFEKWGPDAGSQAPGRCVR